jgi:uncharacterized membrane protein (DUF2068 family)
MKKLAVELIAVVVMVILGRTFGLIYVGIASALIYIPLQIYALAKWKGEWRMASLFPLLIMVPVYAITYRGSVQHGNLWPVIMIFVSPIAVLLLVWLAVARYPGR